MGLSQISSLDIKIMFTYFMYMIFLFTMFNPSTD